MSSIFKPTANRILATARKTHALEVSYYAQSPGMDEAECYTIRAGGSFGRDGLYTWVTPIGDECGWPVQVWAIDEDGRQLASGVIADPEDDSAPAFRGGRGRRRGSSGDGLDSLFASILQDPDQIGNVARAVARPFRQGGNDAEDAQLEKYAELIGAVVKKATREGLREELEVVLPRLLAAVTATVEQAKGTRVQVPVGYLDDDDLPGVRVAAELARVDIVKDPERGLYLITGQLDATAAFTAHAETLGFVHHPSQLQEEPEEEEEEEEEEKQQQPKPLTPAA